MLTTTEDLWDLCLSMIRLPHRNAAFCRKKQIPHARFPVQVACLSKICMTLFDQVARDVKSVFTFGK